MILGKRKSRIIRSCFSVSKKVCLQQIIQPDTLIDCQKDELDFVFCEGEPSSKCTPIRLQPPFE